MAPRRGAVSDPGSSREGNGGGCRGLTLTYAASRRRAGHLASFELHSWQKAGRQATGQVEYMSPARHRWSTSGIHDQLRRTSEYKLAPIRRKIRELLGAAQPNFRRVPRGRTAEEWVGFSTDEIGRVAEPRVFYLRARHPLLELGMSRRDCQRYLRRAGWGDTAKSACIGCPFHGNRQWREMRDQRPEEWADAVEFDRAIRHGGAHPLRPGAQAFLHRSPARSRWSYSWILTAGEPLRWPAELCL